MMTPFPRNVEIELNFWQAIGWASGRHDAFALRGF